MSRSVAMWGSLFAVAALYVASRTERGALIASDAVDAVVNALKPRGIRNNNPGNIDWIENAQRRWRGMVRKETPKEGGRFGVFDSMQNGVRAIAGELRGDFKRGVNTVRGLVSTWAPPAENNTASYIAFVADRVGVVADQRIDLERVLVDFVEAVIRKECGGLFGITRAQIAQWVNS